MKRYEYNYGKNPEGALSTISGYATETTNFGETAFGILNKSTRDDENFTTPEVVSSSTATLFSVGNGTDHDSRKNIIELKADGTVYINGVGQYDGTNSGEATGIADEFQGIHDDITGVNEDIDRIDNTIESIHISEDNANLIYTLLVDGQERGTINIPRDQFLKNVSYNEETNNLEFTFIVRGENNEEVEKQVNVNMTDLEDIYSAGDGLNLENKQFSVKVDADTQPYIEVSSNGVKIIGVDEALDKKVSWDESKKVITLPADGSISALRNNGLEGGVLICQRTYDDGATYVTEIGTTKNNLTLNSIERPKIDFAGGTSENIAYESEVKSLQDRMSTAETDIDNLEGRMNTAESDIDTIQSDLSDLTGDGEGSVQDQIKTALEDYLPLSGGTLTGDVEMENAGLEVVSDDSTASYMSSGVTISGKTATDLLNAAGGTTSVDSIKEGLATKDDLNGYLPLTGGTVTGFSKINGVSFFPNTIRTGTTIIDGDDRVITVGLGTIQIFSSTTASGTPGLIMNGDEIYFSTNGAELDNPGEKYISIGYNGITLKDKSDTDLLNAAGGTTSVSDIIAKVPQPDLSSYATKEEVGSNTYTDSNYISKETNLTDAVIQLDEEIKATNDNLALEHANAEATYAKKTDLSGYLPKQTPTASGALYVSGTASPVSPTLVYSMLNANGITLLDENYESRGSDTELFNTNGGTVSIDDITSQVDLSGYLPLTGGTLTGSLTGSAAEFQALTTTNMFILGSSVMQSDSEGILKILDATSEDKPLILVKTNSADLLRITRSGVYLHNGKDDSLLNSNGGTVSIQDIISQVIVPTKVSELTNDSGYQTEAQVAAKVSALVDSAPETLDTLNELAAALGDDPNFATTVTNQIAQKADKTTATSSADGLMSAADKAKLDSFSIRDRDILAPGFRTPTGTANEVLTADGDSNTLKTIDGQTLLGSGDVDMSKYFKLDNDNSVIGATSFAGGVGIYTPNSETGSALRIFGDEGKPFINCRLYNSDIVTMSSNRIGYVIYPTFQMIAAQSNAFSPDYQKVMFSIDRDEDGLTKLSLGNFDVSEDNGIIRGTDSYITSNGITLPSKSSSDLLHAAGGTTTLKTINGESLLGSGDITTPTPTVNAASGTKTIWTGTQSEYEAVGTKDANTLYFITEG